MPAQCSRVPRPPALLTHWLQIWAPTTSLGSVICQEEDPRTQETVVLRVSIVTKDTSEKEPDEEMLRARPGRAPNTELLCCLPLESGLVSSPF